MTRGGKREGAGRPVGTTKEPTVIYYRRVNPAWVNLLDKFLEELKQKNLSVKTINVGALELLDKIENMPQIEHEKLKPL